MGIIENLKAFFNGQISPKDLEENNEASVVPNSNRGPWADQNVVSGITPERLGSILAEVRLGQVPRTYLELCQEIERRDAHYRSVLSTRKHSVEGLQIQVEATGDDETSLQIAEAVRIDIAQHVGLRNLMKDCLDALGKGFSVSEIHWDTTDPARYRIKEFVHKDPRWFGYAREDARTLCVLDEHGIGMSPLDRRLCVVHEPRLLSGPQILSGLSYTALFFWLVKHFDVTAWAAFVDRFGYPVRLGKYGKKATKEDITTLKRAVAAIGSDIGAVIPDSMVLDIIESKTTASNAEVYEKLASWADRQLSKLVLGQTASADGTPGKLGNEQSQEEVRQDIIDADAAQLETTLNRDLVRTYVALNFGPEVTPPRLVLRRVESQDVTMVTEALAKLVPLGLKVRSEEVRNLLGLTAPDANDEVLQSAPSPASALNSTTMKVATNAEDTEEPESDFVSISDDIAEVLQQAADDSTDFEVFKTKLETLVADWPADKVAELIAVASFGARAQGACVKVG